MAFIREYAMAGDPFRFRLPKRLRRAFTPPKFIRKFQPGRAAASLARYAAPLAAAALPGVGGIAAGLASQYLGDPNDQWARAYGYMAGDPGPKTPKRKAAAAGPKHKAARKATARSKKGGGLSALLGGAGKFLGAHGKQIAQVAAAGGSILQPELAPLLLGGAAALPDAPEEPTGVVDFGAGAPPFTAAAPRMPGQKKLKWSAKHGKFVQVRRTNPANVHALRRAMSRMHSCNDLAHRTIRELSSFGSSSRPHRGSSRRRGLGHRSGCRCVVCSRKG